MTSKSRPSKQKDINSLIPSSWAKIKMFFNGQTKRKKENENKKLVDLYKTNDIFISTTKVTEGRQPYETAVEHASYNDGKNFCRKKMIIVEAYDTIEEAQKGHDKWVKIMTMKNNPRK